MGHLWQRFLLASSLVVGLALGVAATVFGYSNLQTVDIHWAVFHLQGVPLWTVAIVPVALLLIADSASGAGTVTVNHDGKGGSVKADLGNGEHVEGTWTCDKIATS